MAQNELNIMTVDVNNRVILETELGPRPASLDVVIGHEFGHYSGNISDTFSPDHSDPNNRMLNVIRNENPYRLEQGYPLRIQY